jgi:hypothetical protein
MAVGVIELYLQKKLTQSLQGIGGFEHDITGVLK